MKQPLISIITVVYNNKAGIEKTLISVANQTYAAIEYIVIDGGSNDGTSEVIGRYLSGITHYLCEHDHGIYDAMNKGIQLATGELIGIINSGDFYEKEAVAYMVEAYMRTPLADVYHGMLRVFDETGRFLSISGHDSSFLSTGMIEHPTCFVKNAAYRKYGQYSLLYRSSSDYEFMLRLQKQGASFHFVENIIANYFTGGMSYQQKAITETLEIRYQYGLISRVKKIVLGTILKLKAASK